MPLSINDNSLVGGVVNVKVASGSEKKNLPSFVSRPFSIFLPLFALLTMDRNKQTHSSDLLNIPGKNKTLGNMELAPSQTALSHPALSFLIAKLLADQKLTPKQHHQDEDTPMIPPPELRKTFKLDPNNDSK
jgi:hypothetical protein